MQEGEDDHIGGKIMGKRDRLRKEQIIRGEVKSIAQIKKEQEENEEDTSAQESDSSRD